MITDLEHKLKDCEECLKTCSEAERHKLEADRENYRQLITLAKNNKILW